MGGVVWLRPEWLVALAPLAAGWWWLRSRAATGSPDGGRLLAPHLLQALRVGNDQRGSRLGIDAVAVAAIAAAVAAAGPAWTRVHAPWFAETAPLVVALEVSDSMRSADVAPSRLDRARFKVLDLVQARAGAPTAIIAYAGSAHIVAPLSRDANVIDAFLQSLDPDIMPVAGEPDAAAALPLAATLLGADAATGTLLFVNDGFAQADAVRLNAAVDRAAAPALAALVVGTDAGGVPLMPDGTIARTSAGSAIDTRVDPLALDAVARNAGVTVVRATIDEGDVHRLLATVESNRGRTDAADATWRDDGWWLLWPAALLNLLWFRRGGAVAP